MAKKSYKKAGVNIDAGNDLVRKIGPLAAQSHNEHVVDGVGGFASLYRLPEGYKEPLLVSCTDGVGSKLQLAQQHGALSTIGIDLVAMCVNDLLTTGAKPLFFLDYYASSKLEVDRAAEVIGGIASACKQVNCALIGGETAELPGLYTPPDFDLVGFCVGVVERTELLDKTRVQDKDALIAVASSGVHSNGYTLVHNILADITKTKDFVPCGDIKTQEQLMKALLKPTKLYHELSQDLPAGAVHAMAHITGGGVAENLARVLPQHAVAEISHPAAQWPSVFGWLQQQGQLSTEEMRRVFNCGIGMVLCVAQDQANEVIETLNRKDNIASQIGSVALGGGNQEPQVRLSD